MKLRTLIGILTLGAASLDCIGAEAGFAHFITRRGATLYDGECEFRFIGANMPGLILPYDFTQRLPERMTLPTAWEQEDAFKTLDQMNARVVRLWNLPIRAPEEHGAGGGLTWHPVQAPGEFNDESFKVIDRALALANRYGVRVIFNFTAESGDYLGGVGTYAAHRGKKRAEFWSDPQLKDDYRATVRHVLTRRNTVTGRLYKDDRAILAWQFGNEMHSATPEWLAEMAAFIKSLDPNHLVSETRHRPGAPFVIDPNIDLVTRHLYPNYSGVGDGWEKAVRAELDALHGERPLFIGEFGPYVDGKMFTPENVAEKTRAFLEFVRGEKAIAGALLWSMYFHSERGGFYWHQIFTYPAVWAYHWPGFPSADAEREREILAAMRDAAFKIEGREVSPVPAPGAPVLLPATDEPLLTWRGSAGAEGYDIERALSPNGPWVRLAENFSDADAAYRPLFSDTTACTGESWFYRVLARNAAGCSAPSNVVGPVSVARVCLADELRDFSLAEAKSDGLTLTNEFNALYAEHLFRAKGSTGDWLIYRVPGEIESVKVTAFGEAAPQLAIELSEDGDTFSEYPSQCYEHVLQPMAGGLASKQRRVRTDLDAMPMQTAHFLKLRWDGPAELDRVEIRHTGEGRIGAGSQ